MREYERLIERNSVNRSSLLGQTNPQSHSSWNPLHGNLLKTGGHAAQPGGAASAQMTAAALQLQMPSAGQAQQQQLWNRTVGHVTQHPNESSTGQSIGRRYHHKQK